MNAISRNIVSAPNAPERKQIRGEFIGMKRIRSGMSELLDECLELLLLLAGESGGKFKEGGVLGLHTIHFLLGVGVQYLVHTSEEVGFGRDLLCAFDAVGAGDDGVEAGEFGGINR
jgi:hypothetical protein